MPKKSGPSIRSTKWINSYRFCLANVVRHITQLAWRVSGCMRIRIDLFLVERRSLIWNDNSGTLELRSIMTIVNRDLKWSIIVVFRRNTLYGDFLMMEWRSRDHLFLLYNESKDMHFVKDMLSHFSRYILINTSA